MTDIERVETVPTLPARAADAHKGRMGRVLVVGGSGGMIGAPALTANAALRSGAGLVTMALPGRIQLHTAGLCPCATSIALACDGAGCLARQAVPEVTQAAAAADVLAVGPGMATGVAQQMLIRAVLAGTRPVVLDADGLNNLAAIPNWPTLVVGPLVLTPHPGEMARLTGRSIADVQADREAVAIETVRAWSGQLVGEAPLVLLLKGPGTVVTDGQRVYTNPTGNPGMATGGAGDVLTGVIAALIGQGVPPFGAAACGAFVHGVAGDAAADELGEVSLTAEDMIAYLPDAFQSLASR